MRKDTRPRSLAPAALVIGVLGALAAAPVEAAGALRCGPKLISDGDPVTKLKRFCGEPEAVRKRLGTRTFVDEYGRFYPGFIEEIWIEEWTYNFGPDQLMRVVRIENGVVEDVRHLGYGYRKK